MKKRILALLLAAVMLFALCACGGDDPGADDPGKEPPATSDPGQSSDPGVPNTPDVPDQPDGPAAEAGTWAVYWYLCGSDLETNYGCATTDLQEMMEVALPENVKVVIQTGGSQQWHNTAVDATKLQRFVYDSEGLKLVDEQPSASMGEAQTLADFLYFAKTNYPAEKTAVVFWNHGGGSVTGAAFDELYGLDSLDLNEMSAAFSAVWTPDAGQPPLELVGFDTCLMATVDVAKTFRPLSKYLVGSEEVEPGNGWYYSGWLGALAADTTMNGDDLGVAICDAYYQGCELAGTQDNVTLSLTDLGKLDGLLKAYEEFGAQALLSACEDPSFFTVFARAATGSENYGGNTREQGYTNMVDLGHLARQCAGVLGTADAVLAALDECVLYRVNGQYRSEATGLSCYYSYNGDLADFNGYLNVGASDAFRYFFAYGLYGELDGSGYDYIAQWDIDDLPEVVNLTSMGWDGAKLDVTDEGTAYMTLGPDAVNVLAGIGFSLYYVDEANDTMMLLGTDNDMTADWENGVFYDNFRGVWGALDGQLVYMELSFEGEDYNLYSVPILLNGEGYNLQVAYDFTEEAWHIIGATQGIDDSGMADKEMRLLQVGDEITTIWKMASYSGEDDFQSYGAATVIVTENTSFGEAPLFDGSYSMVFEMWDAAGNYAYSDQVTFDCADGEIYTTVYE